MRPAPKHRLSRSELIKEHRALMTGRWLTDLSNTSALLMQHLEDINWVGFYLTDEVTKNILWLGPFQGLPACTEIPFSRGVCGAAAASQKSIRVDDVDQFPGHIVCDSRSKSEIVIPIIVNGLVVGVLDVDSASLSRFDQQDEDFLQEIISNIVFAQTNRT
jgi:L-methionine (R)-S-oxide reductase